MEKVQKFTVRKIGLSVEIFFEQEKNRRGQLFSGDVRRGLDSITGYYHTDKNNFPGIESWDKKYLDTFIEHHDNGGRIGLYLLWFIANLPITKPKLKTSLWTAFDQNIFLFDQYSIRILAYKSECQNRDEIMFEVSKALENFNIDAVFNEIVSRYKDLHLKTNSKKEEYSSTPRPCWHNRIEFLRKTWSYEEAIVLFKKDFEENKFYFLQKLS